MFECIVARRVFGLGDGYLMTASLLISFVGWIEILRLWFVVWGLAFVVSGLWRGVWRREFGV